MLTAPSAERTEVSELGLHVSGKSFQENATLATDADVFFIIDGDTTKERLESDPRWANLPAVKNGLVFYRGDKRYDPALGVPLTPLGTTFFVERFGPHFADAVKSSGVLH